MNMVFFFTFFNRRLALGLILILSTLMVLPSVLALGVSPPYAFADYSDDFNDSFGFTLINNNPDPNIGIELSLDGPLAKFASLSESSFNFDSKTHSFRVFFDFPSYEELGVYGKQKLKINAKEVTKNKGMFNVGTGVGVWVEVYIPVPGSFAEVTSVNVDNAFQGEDTQMTFSLTNRGTEDIFNSYAKVYIKDYTGKIIETLSYPNINIPYDSSVSFDETIHSSSYSSGKYSALVEYVFDDSFSPSTKSDTFFLGSSDVIITDYTSTLIAGEINKVNVTAQSIWGSDLIGVGFNLFYLGSSHNLPSLNFGPFQELKFETFIEAPAIEDKNIDSTTLSAKMDISVPVGDGSFQSKSVPLEFTVVKEKKSFSISSKTLLIVAGSLILLLLIIINIVLLSRTSKKDSKSKK